MDFYIINSNIRLLLLLYIILIEMVVDWIFELVLFIAFILHTLLALLVFTNNTNNF